MVEETEEPVQIHVGRTFQKVLLQRVLEIVDSFIRILQKVVLFWRTALYIFASLVNLLLSRGPLLGASTVVMVTQSSTSSSYLNQLTLPSYDGGCLAVIDKFSAYSLDFWPYLNRLPCSLLHRISAENPLRYHKLRPTAPGAYPRTELVPSGGREESNMPMWMIGWIIL